MRVQPDVNLSYQVSLPDFPIDEHKEKPSAAALSKAFDNNPDLSGFEVLNVPGQSNEYPAGLTEDQINPRRVFLYWNEGYYFDPAKGKKVPVPGDPVRGRHNRHRYGPAEAGDQSGYPLYIRVPDNSDQATLKTMLDTVRATYPDHFKTDKRFDSLGLASHGTSAGYLADGDADGAFDMFPTIGPKWHKDRLQPLELHDETHLEVIGACSQLIHLTFSDLDKLQAVAQANNTAIQVNATVEDTQWSPPVYGKETYTRPMIDGAPIQAFGAEEGPGGNAYRFVPDGYVLPDGTTLDDGGIVRVQRRGDASTAKHDEVSYAASKVVELYWQMHGGHSLDQTDQQAVIRVDNETQAERVRQRRAKAMDDGLHGQN